MEVWEYNHDIRETWLSDIVCPKGKCQRYRSSDLDLGFVQERSSNKVMEREINSLRCGLAQDRASSLVTWEEKKDRGPPIL